MRVKNCSPRISLGGDETAHGVRVAVEESQEGSSRWLPLIHFPVLSARINQTVASNNKTANRTFVVEQFCEKLNGFCVEDADAAIRVAGPDGVAVDLGETRDELARIPLGNFHQNFGGIVSASDGDAAIGVGRPRENRRRRRRRRIGRGNNFRNATNISKIVDD